MTEDETIREQIGNTLEETDLPLGRKAGGKVRDRYDVGDKLFLVTTDRISAFDRVLTTIPFKGQVLNQTSAYWFAQTRDIVPNHVIDVPDPNVLVARKLRILPVEVVIRGYLTGSAWRDYRSGNTVSGVTLPGGMKKDERFETPLFTPSTKAEEGHDEPISEQAIVETGLLEAATLHEVKETALQLFSRGTELAARNGLILVDTKYEFGLDEDGKVILADEIHTPDSSRYWYADTYETRLAEGRDQRMLDKEYLRQWLIREKDWMGEGDIPRIPDEVRVEVARRYIRAYEEITGQDFDARPGPVSERMERNLREGGYL